MDPQPGLFNDCVDLAGTYDTEQVLPPSGYDGAHSTMASSTSTGYVTTLTTTLWSQPQGDRDTQYGGHYYSAYDDGQVADDRYDAEEAGETDGVSALPQDLGSTRAMSNYPTSKKSRSDKMARSSKAPNLPLESSSSSSSSSKRKQKKGREPRSPSPEPDGHRREKFLERNRIAASKCRQKKKAWVSDLEEQKYSLESQNSSLTMEYNDLLGEVTRMKNQLMAHASCRDGNIDRWIENEARRYVNDSTEVCDQEEAVYRRSRGGSGRHYGNPNVQGHGDDGMGPQPSPNGHPFGYLASPATTDDGGVHFDYMTDGYFDRSVGFRGVRR